MSISVQTPVQIAWVTHDLDTTETALTGLLGAKKWVRMPDVHFGPDTCTYRGEPADFVHRQGVEGRTTAQGVMPGGMQFAYLSAPAAGIPFVEIAYIPDDIQAFFDYIKQEQV